MFIRASTTFISVVALAGAVAAVPSTAIQARQSSTCNSGNVQCCNSVQSSSSPIVGTIFGWLGIPLPITGTQVGFTCSPITLGGFGLGGTCVQQTVCCEGNTFNGISTGCSPIIINL